jgi:CheY-like chemotaxis protein
MVPLLVLLTVVVFLIVDIATRLTISRLQESKRRKRRQEALDIGLRLEYTDVAESLRRVEVENPKARILAVDDEAIVLDSFRKILVMAGYSIDTVETGKEAVGLVRKIDYDFVFTDLKMPEMDGLDVTKAVKHLRPDIDVVIITGYATVESAVDAMKFGAMDYVQKPFTADELVDFAERLVIRREDRIRHQRKPEIHLVTPSVRPSAGDNKFNVPSGIFFTRHHTWIDIQSDGMLLVGLDDFAEKFLGPIEGVELPEKGRRISKGEPLFTIHRGTHRLTLPAPASGKIAFVNDKLYNVPELVNRKPFDDGWVCGIDPSNLPGDLHTFRIGASAVAWYEGEVERYSEIMQELIALEKEGSHEKEETTALRWEAFERAIDEERDAQNSMSTMEGQEKWS